ncbi:MAG: helix-turn-helix domain-containing protein [bacterium]|nr:helix-turn-helix domain-containing protein [bacterium]
MVNIKDAKFRDIGLQLRAIREELKMTADVVSKETGISRSYLSDFERGVRLPTSKYLNYLSHRHNVDLNYIFRGEGRKFMPKAEEAAPNFGKFQEEVDTLLRFMVEMPAVRYAVLGFFAEYQLRNRELFDRHQSEKRQETGETGK